MSIRLSAADRRWHEAVAVVRSVFFTAAYAERVERVGEEGAGWQGPDAPRLRARAGLIEPARWRKRTASGQALAKAMRTRLAVSVTRAATFRSRSLIVVNSALARAWALGMASRTARTSQ